MGLFSRRAASLPPGDPVRSPRAMIRTATDGRDVLLNTPDGWEVDTPGLWWFGPDGGDGTGGPYGNPLTSDDPAGLTNLPAVNRCTSIIADTLAGMPWHVMRGEYEQLPTPDWLSDPQATRLDGRVVGGPVLECRLSAVEFWAQWITAALWLGDGYVYVPVRDAAGAPKPPLWQLHPADVTIDVGTYWVGDVPLPAGSILHLRGMPPYYKGHGRGVITTHGASLGLSATVQNYAAGVFTTGVPAGYLKSAQPNMSEADALALKQKWLAQHGGSRRSIAVLNATTDFHAVQISPIDAQLGDARVWGLRDVATSFNLPPYILGVPGDPATYANVESRMIELKTFTHMPWGNRISATLGSQFPRGTDLKIVYDALLRADTKTRYEAYKLGLDGGWLTVDEVRALEDRAPLPAAQGVT